MSSSIRMDRNYILKHNVIERYLLHKLSPEERDEFEQFYLNDPQTLNELEIARRLLTGLRKSADDRSD